MRIYSLYLFQLMKCITILINNVLEAIKRTLWSIFAYCVFLIKKYYFLIKALKLNFGNSSTRGTLHVFQNQD